MVKPSPSKRLIKVRFLSATGLRLGGPAKLAAVSPRKGAWQAHTQRGCNKKARTKKNVHNDNSNAVDRSGNSRIGGKKTRRKGGGDNNKYNNDRDNDHGVNDMI